MAVIAYARVSTEGQTLEAQLAQLKHAKAERIFKEKVSGARADRPQLKKAIAALEPGMSFSSPALIAWPAPPVTSSTCWTRSPARVLASAP